MIHLVSTDSASPVVCTLLLVPVLVSSKLNSINPSVLQVLDCTLPFNNKRISRKERERDILMTTLHLLSSAASLIVQDSMKHHVCMHASTYHLMNYVTTKLNYNFLNYSLSWFYQLTQPIIE